MKNLYPLSLNQQGLWFLERRFPNRGLYNNNGAYRLPEDISPAALRRAAERLSARHPALRTTFSARDGIPCQIVHDHLPPDFREIHLENTDDTELTKVLDTQASEPLDLERGPLLRWVLISIRGQRLVLSLMVHHIIADGWSDFTILAELGTLYREETGEPAADLAPLKHGYRDFVREQAGWLESSEAKRERLFWREKLSGHIPVLDLPTDRSRRGEPSFKTNVLPFPIPVALQTGMRQLAKDLDVRPLTLWLSAWFVFLHRLTGQEDLVSTIPVAGRGRKYIGVVGYFVNALPVRVQCTGEESFREFLQRTTATVEEVLARQNYPLSLMMQGAAQDTHTALSQAHFAWQNYNFPGKRGSKLAVTARKDTGDIFHIGGMAWELIRFWQHPLEADIQLWVMNLPDNQYGVLYYSSELFDQGTMERWAGYFVRLLEGIVAQPETGIAQLPLLTEAERQRILVEWNATATPYPQDKCVHELFEEQAARIPDAIAVVFEEEKVSYRELNERANRLVHRLRELGVEPEVLVGIFVERSVEMVVGLLAILKAGGAYVPLDPEYPKERLVFMAEDANLKVLLCHGATRDRLPKCTARILDVDAEAEAIAGESPDNPAQLAGPENLAYVIYTSGSTGKPKGVCVEHGNIVRLVRNTNYMSFDETQVFLQMALMSFDAATFEVWGSLLNGAKLIVPLPGHLSLEDLDGYLREYGVTVLFLTTALFNLMVKNRPDDIPKLDFLLCGGEVGSPEHLKQAAQLLGPGKLIHCYGPTENTTFTTCYAVPSDPDTNRPVPIGNPISNTRIYILDGQMNPVPVGVGGELYTGGAGVARGYLNRPELTFDKFIPNPFTDDPQGRLYRTGDLCRWLPDGTIEFLGRMDSQVKIRGFRIEPGEIEAALNRHPDVQDVAVVIREDEPGQKHLAAFVTSDLVPTRIPYEADCRLEYRDRTAPMRTVDICTAGVLLEGDAGFEKGETVQVQVRLPGETEPRLLQGRVAYSRDSDTGIDFRLTPEEQALMDQGVIHELEDKGFISFLQYSLRDKLRLALQKELPDYMIPSEFVLLISLPLTPNGKVDRRALSERPIKALQRPGKGFVAPRTAEEEALAVIWGNVLGVERVGVHDDFFDLGGHSLLAISLLSRVEKEFARNLPLSALFQGPTVAELAERLACMDAADTVGESTDPWRPLVLIREGGPRPPFFCLPGAGGNILYFQELAHALDDDRAFYGLQAVGLDGISEPDTRIEEMATRYIREIRTVQPHGPYFLGGHCFGSWVALEMAKQLQQQGEKVERLAVFDSTVPFHQPIGAGWSDSEWIVNITRIIGRLLGTELVLSDAALEELDADAQLGHLHGLLEQNGWPISMKQLTALVRIFKANARMGYVPQDMPPIPITLFKASELSPVGRSGEELAAFSEPLKKEPTWGWGRYAAGPADIRMVPGDHYTMMSRPNVQVLAENLRGCLAPRPM